jgi:Holliday junction resolvase RusA-like endonuclease
MTFDPKTATVAEWQAEGKRRSERARRGLPLHDDRPHAAPPGPIVRPTVAFMRFVIPWSYLVTDNAKYAPALRGTKPAMILTDAYRAASKRIHQEALNQLDGAGWFVDPVSLQGVLFEPNQTAQRDITNYCKVVHDALEGVAYKNDRQIWRAVWERGPIDIDRPRLELTVRPLT